MSTDQHTSDYHLHRRETDVKTSTAFDLRISALETSTDNLAKELAKIKDAISAAGKPNLMLVLTFLVAIASFFVYNVTMIKDPIEEDIEANSRAIAIMQDVLTANTARSGQIAPLAQQVVGLQSDIRTHERDLSEIATQAALNESRFNEIEKLTQLRLEQLDTKASYRIDSLYELYKGDINRIDQTLRMAPFLEGKH